MRRVSMATRDELVAAVIERYSKGRRAEKGRILDEFVAVTGFHRKHAMRVLRGGQATRRSAPRPERRLYDEAVREALIVIWEASDRVCGKRLKALAPILVEAMERHGHLQLAPEVRTRLLAMSAATMDRALRPVRAQAGGGPRRRTAPSSAVRRSVPVRTFGLARSAAGVCRSGLGGAQRPLGERQLCADAGVNRHCDGMDRVRAVAGPGAGPAERGFDGAAQAAALRPARVRHGQ